MQSPPKKLLDQVRDAIRLKHYAEIIPASCAILFLSTLAAIFAICLTYRVKQFQKLVVTT
jgi:hypothetical protein